MKPKEVAEAKTERLYEELLAALRTEAATTRSKANLTGSLHSSRLYVQYRVLCIAKMEQLKKSAVHFYVETLGHKLDLAATKEAISAELGLFFETCKNELFEPARAHLGMEQMLDAFEKEAEHLLHQLDDDLQIAIHEAKKTAPSFWKDKKHDVWLAIISGLIGAILGVAGTLITLWLTKAFKLGSP